MERIATTRCDFEDVLASDGKITTKRQELMRSKKSRKGSKVEYTTAWTEGEKKILLDALYEHGDKDLKLLELALPNKHATQIQTYLRTLKRRAYMTEKNRGKSKKSVGLDKWIEHLKNNYKDQLDGNKVPFELFSASREFSIPNTEYTNEIVDFQKAYEYLYALTIGRKIDIDDKTYYFVHSYLDWFLNQFENFVLPKHLTFLTSALKKKKGEVDEPLSPDQVLGIMFHKVLPSEQFLNNKHLLKTVCRKIRRNSFKKGDEYDKKISLIRAELDEGKRESSLYSNPPLCSLIPYQDTDVKFKNLPSFLWAAIHNTDHAVLKDIA